MAVKDFIVSEFIALRAALKEIKPILVPEKYLVPKQGEPLAPVALKKKAIDVNRTNQNEIILLDFSHFSPRDEEDENFDIHFSFIGGNATYQNAYSKYLDDLIKEPSSDWRNFNKNNVKHVYNFDFGNNFSGKQSDIRVTHRDLRNKPVKSDFAAETHLFGSLQTGRFPGKGMMIYAETHGKAQSIVYVLFSKPLLDNTDFLDLNNYMPEDFVEFDKRLNNLLVHEMIEGLAKEKSRSAQKMGLTATRAAISQVMARNLSHNIGSHCMINLTDGDQLSRQSHVICSAYQSKINIGKESEMIRQLAHYNHYVKCRMDYLSDITLGTPVMDVGKRVYSDLFKELDKVRLLLDNISGLSSNFPYTLEFLLNDEPLNDENDFAISLPNDLLGCQAFYNIIENVIRNTAKHNHSKLIDDKGNPILTRFIVNFKNMPIQPSRLMEDCWYEVEIYDNIVNNGQDIFEAQPKHQQDYYRKRHGYKKKIKASNTDYLVFEQNEKFNRSILNDQEQLRNYALGLLEMEASAAYLRKLEITDIEKDHYKVDHKDRHFNSNNKFNILKAFNKDGALGYRFFVSKPSEFLFIGDFNLSSSRISELMKDGIAVKSEANFLSELETGSDGKPGIVFNHHFLITQNFNSSLEVYNTSIPSRILEIGNGDTLQNLLVNGTALDIEHYVWRQWFDKASQIAGFDSVELMTSYQYRNHTLPETKQKCFFIGISHHNTTNEVNVSDYNFGKLHAIDCLSSDAVYRLPDIRNLVLTEYIYKLSMADQWADINNFKLFEAYQNRILVLDERIQRHAKQEYQGINIHDIYSRCHVVLPIEIDLSAGNFDSKIVEHLENYVLESITGKNKCSFFLIHYSILERMYGTGHQKINSQLTIWSEMANLIVTSGKGKPTGLPSDKVRFLNLSPILNAFIQIRSKYSINYLLNSARK